MSVYDAIVLFHDRRYPPLFHVEHLGANRQSREFPRVAT